MVIVGRGAVCGEILSWGAGIVDVRDEMTAHLGTVFQEDVHTVVVADEVG